MNPARTDALSALDPLGRFPRIGFYSDRKAAMEPIRVASGAGLGFPPGALRDVADRRAA